jgi:HPt (histidine-containing phosphotransfer) domain-containing protein
MNQISLDEAKLYLMKNIAENTMEHVDELNSGMDPMNISKHFLIKSDGGGHGSSSKPPFSSTNSFAKERNGNFYLNKKEQEVIDIADALEKYEQDECLFFDLLKKFAKSLCLQSHKIDEAYANKDYTSLKRYAHSMKGSSAYVSAKSLSKASSSLSDTSSVIEVAKNSVGLEGNYQEITTEVDEAYARLKKEISKFNDFVLVHLEMHVES